MRLVCPNCDAEYEVDAAAIPSAGRDVQCSNCGTLWFQPSPAAEAAFAEETSLFDAPETGSVAQIDGATAQSAPAAVPADEMRAGKDHATDAAKPRGLDDAVVAVLREEAEREAAARRAEASQPIETQTEMGLAPAAAQKPASLSASAERIAMIKGVEPEPRAAHRTQSRREMLPAIEEINSTLRATSERRKAEPASFTQSMPAPRPKFNSFRNGFILILLVAAIALVTYAMAPRIGQQIPGLAATMTGYVETVDSARMWLDTVMQQAISVLRGLSKDQTA